MYSIVLMMALSDGAALPSAKPVEMVPAKRAGAQELNRGHGCRGCHGCYGGCYGCYGGCYGCYGGCYGCYGGCWGGGCYGGCYGGGMAYRSNYYAPAGGYYSYYPATTGGYQSYYAGGQPAQTQAAAPAQIVVNLPADAQLSVDGTQTQQTSARRVFATPPLSRGFKYSYTLTATAVRDGQTVTTTKEIPVSAGAVQEVRLDFSNRDVAQR